MGKGEGSPWLLVVDTLSGGTFFLLVVAGLLSLSLSPIKAQTVGDYSWQILLNSPSNPQWQPLLVTDPRGTSAAIVNNLLVIYGGDMTVYTPPYSWVYDLTTNTWLNNTAFITQLVDYSGISPGRCASVAVGGKVWSFGGSAGALYIDLTSIQIFDPATWTWSQQALTGGPPTQREAHGTVYDPATKNVYVYGGFDGLSHLNDFWKASTTTLQWTFIQGPLVGILAVSNFLDWYDVYTRNWYIFGGRNGANPQNQFFVIFTANESWSHLPNAGAPLQQFGYAFPKLPYSTTANGLASTVTKMGAFGLVDYYPSYNAFTGSWMNISTTLLTPQLGYGFPVTRPAAGNTFDVYLYYPITGSVWKLTSNTTTGGSFITSPNSNALNVVVSFPTDEPTIALTPKDDGGTPVVGAASSIGFGDLTELDVNGTVIRSVIINEQTLQIVATVTGAGTESYIFETEDESIQLEFNVLSNDTTFISGSIPFLVSQNAVKLSISISEWIFDSNSSILRVRLPYTTPFSNSMVERNDTSQPNIVIFTITDGGSQKYIVRIRCLTVAEINGTEVSLLKVDIVDYNNGTGSVELFFPQFSSSLRYDPDFSVTFQGNSESDNSDDTTLIIALSVGLGAGIPIVAMLLFLLILGITIGCTFYQRRKFRNTNSTGNVSF